MPFDWYAQVDSTEIEQGDILLDIEIPVPREPTAEGVPVDYETRDLIVMTQSCDIPKSSCSHIILCPVWSISAVAQLNSWFGSNPGKESIRQGRVIGYHMLNECGIEGLNRELSVVQFERIIEQPKDVIQSFVASKGNRIRLLPPYREHLAQAFARFFMRVGLPIDIPKFT